MKHLGVVLRPRKYQPKLIREEYAIINKKPTLPIGQSDIYDETGQFYSDEWCEKFRADCLYNFDLNMKYFSSLDHDDFDNALSDFVSTNGHFKRIYDLHDCDKMSGCYLMVLDEYNQVYIGISNDIKRRIQQHWDTTKSFDRLLFPWSGITTSILSIDSFRALDTTRLYVCCTDDYFDVEEDCIEHFPQKFILNRIPGGRIELVLTKCVLQNKSLIRHRELT